MFQRPDKIAAPLHVVTTIFNPQRWRSRWALYEKFAKHVQDAGAVLWTVEVSFGERQAAITSPCDAHHIQLRTWHELWLKENALNIGIQRLPADWRYVAWIDADVQFVRPDWVGETLHALQHYHVVQMFTEAQDLDDQYRVVKSYTSFLASYQCDHKPGPNGNSYGGKGGYWHPGFAWAARREAIDALGGLVDWAILGGGDTFMAYALIGQLGNRTMPRSLGAAGVRWLIEWQHRAERHIRRNVGAVRGTLLHHWHGRRADRAYRDRGQILTGAGFNPERDLKRDWQNLWQLSDRSSIALRDDIRRYFAQRNEDALP